MIRIIKESWSFLSSEDMKNYRGASVTLKRLGKKTAVLNCIFTRCASKKLRLRVNLRGLRGASRKGA